MKRLVSLGSVLAFVSVCHTIPQYPTVVVDNGNVGIGLISGGTFGPGSFSIGHPGSSPGQTNVYVNQDGDSKHIFIQTSNHKDQNRHPQDSDAGLPNKFGGTNTGNTQLYPTGWKGYTVFNTGLKNGSISIGGVLLNKHENNKVNKQPDGFDASAIGTAHIGNSVLNGYPISGVAVSSDGSIAAGDITGSNFEEGGLSFNTNGPGTNVPQQQSAASNGDIGYQNTGANNGNFGSQNTGENSVIPSTGVAFSSGGSIAIGSITGGNFGEGGLSFNTNRPGTKMPQQQSAAKNGDIGYQNTGANSGNIGFQNTGENSGIPSTGVAFSSGGSIAIGAITGGNFGEGGLSFNTKRPGTNVPQQQSAVNNGDNLYHNTGANNGDIGDQDTGNKAPFSIGHGVNKPKNGNAFDIDPNALKTIFGSNNGNNEPSSTGISFSNSGQGSVAIGAITEGDFGQGTFNLDNKRPGANVPQPQTTVINITTEQYNADNGTPSSKQHGTHSNGDVNAGVYNQGQSSSGYNAYNNEKPWVWTR